MKRQRRRQRGRDRAIKWRVVTVFIKTVEILTKNKLKNNFIFSANTWGGNVCAYCGLELPSPALQDAVIVDTTLLPDDNIIGPLTFYTSPCRYVSNCPGDINWQGIETTGKARMIPNWQLVLYRDVLNTFKKK